MATILDPNRPRRVAPRRYNRQDVFFLEDDRRVYPEFLRKYFGIDGAVIAR